MDFRFTKEQEMLQKEIRRFAEEKLEPIAAEVDELDEVDEEEVVPILDMKSQFHVSIQDYEVGCKP